MPAADTVLLNGEVLVFRGIEQRSPGGERGAAERPEFAEAVAISGGRIVFTGEAAEAKRYVGPATKVIDLGGRMVMPGIVDGHFHGTRATDCHLGYEGGTVPQILARLQACRIGPTRRRSRAPARASRRRISSATPSSRPARASRGTTWIGWTPRARSWCATPTAINSG